MPWVLRNDPILPSTLPLFLDIVTSRMLKKSASGVLALLKGSTLRGTPRIFEILKGRIGSPRLIARANGSTKCGPYLLASSLAAALPVERRVSARRGWAGEKSGLFEHPATILKRRRKEDFTVFCA
jgi:hypothetical protein